MAFKNEGKQPFEIKSEIKPPLEEMRKQERKIMGLGLKKFKCKVPQNDLEGNKPIKNKESPLVLMETKECTNCHSKIRVEASYCPVCHYYC